MQNCVLTCRSRELEGDGEGEVPGAGTPSCSLISFAEFNHGAVKNKVCIYSCYNLWGNRCKAFKTLLCYSCVYEHNNECFSFLLQCQTVKEVFARQLMQISGLSGDKAAAILERYSTPHRWPFVAFCLMEMKFHCYAPQICPTSLKDSHTVIKTGIGQDKHVPQCRRFIFTCFSFLSPSSLLTAYERCSSEAEKEKLLSSIRYGKLNRSVDQCRVRIFP